MTEVWETIIRYVLIAAISYAAGTIVQYRQYRVRGMSLLVPFVPKSSRNFTIVVVTLSLLTTFSVITAQIQQQHQAECNADFQRALRENARINSEDRDLEKRDDALREQRDAALTDLVEGLLTVPPGAGGGQVRDLLERYETTIVVNDRERGDLIAARGALEQQRRDNPYPEPKCD